MPCPSCTSVYDEPNDPMNIPGYIPAYPPTGVIMSDTTKAFVAGMAVGGLLTLFMVALTGQTSLTGAAKATGRAIKKMF